VYVESVEHFVEFIEIVRELFLEGFGIHSSTSFHELQQVVTDRCQPTCFIGDQRILLDEQHEICNLDDTVVEVDLVFRYLQNSDYVRRVAAHFKEKYGVKVYAARAGKHVLCEKPIGLDVDDLDRLIAAREATGRLIAEAWMPVPVLYASFPKTGYEKGILTPIHEATLSTHEASWPRSFSITPSILRLTKSRSMGVFPARSPRPKKAP